MTPAARSTGLYTPGEIYPGLTRTFVPNLYYQQRVLQDPTDFAVLVRRDARQEWSPVEQVPHALQGDELNDHGIWIDREQSHKLLFITVVDRPRDGIIQPDELEVLADVKHDRTEVQYGVMVGKFKRDVFTSFRLHAMTLTPEAKGVAVLSYQWKCLDCRFF